MIRTRIIPSLLIADGGLVKTVKFRSPRYIGDPINAIRIFNDKEVDEICVLDIQASRRGSIDFQLLSRINREAFVPLSYGGGLRTASEVERVLALGYEKVVLNASALERPALIGEVAGLCGSSSVVICIDVHRGILGRPAIWDYTRKRTTKLDPVDWAKRCQDLGAGEILLYSVDRDGTGQGYDEALVSSVSATVTVPVIALGGAGSLADFKAAKAAGASAAAAGSLFVFKGPHKAVLITYPNRKEIRAALNE